MEFVWVGLLILALCVFWSLTLVGLPGNWANLLVAACYWFLLPEDGRFRFGASVLLTMLLLALLGEVLEFAAGALGATKAGGSIRGAALAVAGSMIGGVAGLLVGLPIPVVGPVVAAVLFASLGAMIGSLVGEQWKGRQIKESWQVGWSAFWGRMLGTVGKLICGIVMVVVAAVALFV